MCRYHGQRTHNERAAFGLMVAGLALALSGGCGSDSATDDPPGDADAGPFDPGLDSSFVFDESVIRTYELTIAQADYDYLNEDPRREEYVPATLAFEGEVYDQVAVRYKGGFGTLGACVNGQGQQVCDKLSMKLKFSEYDPERRFFGLKRLNFHSMESDQTRMHDAIGYALFREMGVYAPRSTYARLVINGELIGLHALVEQIDGRFTRMNFPDGGEGNLYKQVWPEHLAPEPYIGALKTNEDEMPSADKMVRFAQDLANVSDATFVATLERWTDLDMLMRFMAVDRLIDNWDGIVAWYCFGGSCFNHNFYWYESTTEDKVWLIPWDLDNTFAVPSPIRTAYGMPDWDDNSEGCQQRPIFFGIQGRPPACDPLIRRMATVTFDRYAAATRELLDDQFQIPALRARIDALADHIRDAVAEDPNGITVQEWEAAVAQLKDDIVEMRAYVEAKLP